MAHAVMLLVLMAGPTPTAQGGLAKAPVFFAISVPNLDTSVKWYTESLGLTATLMPATAQAKVAVVRGEGLLVELIQPAKPVAESTSVLGPRERHLRHGLVKVGFHVEDLDAAVARLRRNGVRIMGSAYSDEGSGVRSILVLDNNENLIQLFEPLPRQ